ncbi:MAG: tetratricopeptide repeat protein [Candidatus Kapabacteria bacterium]|nr:tetratricopeptide repeat protein [Candidatus Kapabacteria bacterium]
MDRRTMMLSVILNFLLLVLISQNPVYCGSSQGIRINYPTDGSVFPPDISAPTFKWSDDSPKSSVWLIEIKDDMNIILTNIAYQKQWKPNPKEWEMLKTHSIEKDLTVRISASDQNASNNSMATIKFRTSKDSVIAPIFYRDVPLPFSFARRNLDKVCWRLGYIDNDTTAKIVMEKLPVCANCHTFSMDGKTMGMDVDAHSDKDAYAIADIQPNTVLHQMIRWSTSQNGLKTYGLLTSASPDGNYFISTLKDNEFFIPLPDSGYSQLFFPIKGVLTVYNRETDKFWDLPGASDTNLVSSNPIWSPDSKFIYFVRTKAIPSKESGFSDALNSDSATYAKLIDDFLSGRRSYKFDIYRVPFNNGKGGKELPVAGASENGMSNYFPKVSPDGKWLIYTQSANYMLLQPDSKLWIIPADGGKARELICNAEAKMNSWHSWSPNSRWLVFSSKRQGIYTKLYLTHIDKDGNDSPAILLENFCLPGRAVNIPEFVNVCHHGLQKIEPKFLQNDYFAFQDGIRKFEQQDYHGAMLDFKRALSIDSNNYITYGARGYIFAEMGKNEEALRDYNKSLQLKQDVPKVLILRGFIKIELKDIIGAERDFETAIKINPNDPESLKGMGYTKILQGKFDSSVYYLNLSIKLDPKNRDAHFQRALAYYNLGQIDRAINDFSNVIRIEPNFHLALFYRGSCYLETGQKEKACKDFETAKKLGSEEAAKSMNENCK